MKTLGGGRWNHVEPRKRKSKSRRETELKILELLLVPFYPGLAFLQWCSGPGLAAAI